MAINITLSSEQVTRALADYMLRATPSAAMARLADAAGLAAGGTSSRGDAACLAALADLAGALGKEFRAAESAALAVSEAGQDSFDGYLSRAIRSWIPDATGTWKASG